MQLFPRRQTVISACLVALGVALAVPAAGAVNLPEPPVKKKGFRLFARAGGSLQVNQVFCSIISNGQICVDSLESSTVPGGFWPKGTNNQYTFNSGISIAAIIGPELPAWAGDTTGAFFFDGGGKQNGEQVEPIYNASDPVDFANWPEFARVPGAGDAGSAIYDQLLQGQVSASQGDVYFIAWDGNPSALAGRPHPLGVAVETRGLAWNFPAGNQDILYFIYTLYNISSVRDADYVNIRPALKTRLLQLAADFQAANEAAFAVDIPDGGYTIERAFMNFAADQDVADATGNYSSFNNLFNLAVTYHETFQPLPGNTFDPGLHPTPFLPGPGFVGTKYLRSPLLEDGTEAGTVLAGLTTNRGAFPDPLSTTQLYRYISGNLNSAAGDPQCNTGDPAITHLCFIPQNPSDTRSFQSTGPLTLPAGGQATIVMAYIFAPPVRTGKCPSIPCPVTMLPDPLVILGATPANPGADAIDSAMGYLGFLGQTVVQDSVRTVPNSLLDKAKVAQAIFDSKFLLPFAPTAPEFFLVPGDGQITVLWRPSTSETTGDAFFGIANDPNRGTQYDPSYRQFDVEGYRIYRGRVDSPNALELLAQFDYDGTRSQMFDFRGLVFTPAIAPDAGIPFNDPERCAPELGVVDGCGAAFPTIPPTPPDRFTDSLAIALTGPIIQVRPGQRVKLENGTVRNNLGPAAVDTLVTGLGTGFPRLANTGVPFAFADNGSGLLSAPRNNVRYFYTVTAFDVNSFASGPASLESQRTARAVVPVRQAPNVQTATLQSGFFGDDGTELSPEPTTPFTIDPQTGRFSGTPPATALAVLEGAFSPLIPSLLPALSLTATIDSVLPRGAAECGDKGNFRGFCAEFFLTFDREGQAPEKFQAITAWPFFATTDPPATAVEQLGTFPVAPDATSAARYRIPEGAASFNAAVQATLSENIRFSAQENQQARRLLTNVSPGGSRWFEGANETLDDPAYSIRVGHLNGVDSIYTPLSHTDQDPVTAGVQQPVSDDACLQLPPHFLAPMGRQADIELTWGAGGTVASVRDLTHHVAVPFAGRPQASYGFVTDGNGNGRIDWADFIHTPGVWEAVQDFAGAAFCGPPFNVVGPGPINPLVPQATVTPVSFTTATGGTQAPAAFTPSGNGFGLYINGQQFIFALTGGALPAEGTKWTLRMYSGVVRATANPGTTDPSGYTYTPAAASPAITGLKVQFTVAAATTVAAAQDRDLTRVHTVPDPYYVTSGYETSTTDKIIRFVNLPTQAIIRIYSSSGVLVRVLQHNSLQRGDRDEDVSVLGGEETWDVRNRNNQVVASGVYFYHLEAGDARRVGRFTVVNFAQ